jgi:ribosomal protein L6P/L9E
MPLPVPKGVDVSLTAEQISVKGSLGTLVRPVNELGITNNCFKDIVGREPLSLEDFLEWNRDSLLQTR